MKEYHYSGSICFYLFEFIGFSLMFLFLFELNGSQNENLKIINKIIINRKNKIKLLRIKTIKENIITILIQ